MSASGYTAWSVTAGEVPTTAYWNVLGSNDASFNSGNGFNDGIIQTRHIGSGIQLTPQEQNPYNFSVYRNAAYTTVNSASTPMPFDTALYDTGGNYSFANNQFVATVSGFYLFNGFVYVQSAVSNGSVGLYKNGSTFVAQGEWNAANNVGFPVTKILQLIAGDTISLHYFTSATVALYTGKADSYFEGYLVSAT